MGGWTSLSDDDAPLSDLADEFDVDATDEHRDADATDEHRDADATDEHRDDDATDEHRDADGDTGDRRADAPLSELAAEVAADADAVDTDDSPFETVDTGEIDPEEAWERLESDEGFEQPGPDASAAPVDEATTDDPEHVVDKRQYCQQCPYLSSPPEITCGHDGTEILEVRDGDSFRVRNCPMIGEDGPNFDAAGDS